ncbi:SDR family NAD(P)-dependent oxidoreductase [Streptomyces sp. NRRL F-2664]|uniref:SDR family NAD(P)-dependent oxidoreductase n=1 Tax=Streptomyces sp. NRRL F-2664 TaxID=1463842 RepID=UPI001F46F389|nr:SDR family NAD(P)-dependent oxidoreductase [Streptomyces sp. NRRL F-2664]
MENLLSLLEQAAALPAQDARRRRIEGAAKNLLRRGRRDRRAQARLRDREVDAALLAATATGARDRVMDTALPAPSAGPRPLPAARRKVETSAAGPTPAAGQPAAVGSLRRSQRCYVCKTPYREVHPFYHRLCMPCAGSHLDQRTARTDLGGRRALLTGGRVKIGHELALMLLRDGADLTVTTRFPRDAAARFAAAPDRDLWWERLTIAALDLRDPRQVLAFTDQELARGRPLDILVNNAAQTLRRPPEAYAALAAAEAAGLPPARHWAAPGFTVPGSAQLALTAGGTAEPAAPGVPAGVGGVVDAAGLLPDTAPMNSWTLQLGHISAAELIEVQLVNAVAPFLLADRLLPLMEASPHPRRYLINVSAVEGQFGAPNKSPDHPHTNMAKAALNMLTRTSAAALAARGIHCCSVDTGWITDEKPAAARARHASTGWRPPLDVVDGAARIYHPIREGEAGRPLHAVFLKDYRPAAW